MAEVCSENRSVTAGGHTSKKKNVSWRRFFLYAAVVVVVAFVGWQANAYYSGISSSVELVTLETEVGQQARTVLPDGSTVLLNACSKLTYSLGGVAESTRCTAGGRSDYSIVKHKMVNRFYVHTRHYDIRVLGTNFNVSSYAEEAEDIVTLKNGKAPLPYCKIPSEAHAQFEFLSQTVRYFYALVLLSHQYIGLLQVPDFCTLLHSEQHCPAS